MICEIAPSYRLDFLYDENDELYGFIKDGSSKYFYVRDFLQNITGIIDSNGKFVVKYNCSAYGNVSVLQDTNGLAAINPFLYKGYYFDKESGMFYCHTRYYVPEWCRWLNADNIAYIRPDNAQQMNLFAYCGNNPISFWDPEGTKKTNWKAIGKILFSVFVVSALAVAAVLTVGTAAVIFTGAAIGAGVGMATGIANGVIQGKETGDYLGAIADNMATNTISGAISGALAGSPVGLAGQIVGNALISGGTYLISNAVNGRESNLTDFAISVGFGALAGRVGGTGALAVDSKLLRSVSVSVWNLTTPALVGAASGEFSTALSEFLRWL